MRSFFVPYIIQPVLFISSPPSWSLNLLYNSIPSYLTPGYFLSLCCFISHTPSSTSTYLFCVLSFSGFLIITLPFTSTLPYLSPIILFILLQPLLYSQLLFTARLCLPSARITLPSNIQPSRSLHSIPLGLPTMGRHALLRDHGRRIITNSFLPPPHCPSVALRRALLGRFIPTRSSLLRAPLSAHIISAFIIFFLMVSLFSF